MFGTPENKGSPATKAVAAAVASLPEGFTIQPLEVAKICLQLVCKSASLRMPAVHGSLLRVFWRSISGCLHQHTGNEGH
jgi:hypothetical protein